MAIEFGHSKLYMFTYLHFLTTSFPFISRTKSVGIIIIQILFIDFGSFLLSVGSGDCAKNSRCIISSLICHKFYRTTSVTFQKKGH